MLCCTILFALQAQLNWHQQYLPSQQFYDQHQGQLRSMGGGGVPGSTPDQSEEGMLKAKGSFYKSIKSSSTSSLDLLGTLATSISRENLVSYGTSGDTSFGTDTSSGSGMGSMVGGTGLGLSRADTAASSASNNMMKRNSKSIQDFWMLVEMGDLSRPDQEDLDLHNTEDVCVDSAVFDIEEENKAQAQAQVQVQVQVQAQVQAQAQGETEAQAQVQSPSHPPHTGAGVGGWSGVSTVSRCESAPALSSTSSSFAPVPVPAHDSTAAYSDSNSDSNSNNNSNLKDTTHDPVVLQSLLSMASAEHLRIDQMQSSSSSSSSDAASRTLPTAVVQSTHSDTVKQEQLPAPEEKVESSGQM
mgnify:CR=1 FL=1